MLRRTQLVREHVGNQFSISRSLIVDGLAVPAIHMLSVTSETCRSSEIRGMLRSESSTNRVRSRNITCLSDSSEAIAFVCSGKCNRVFALRSLPRSASAILITNSFLVVHFTYDVECQLQIAGNFIGDWHVHIDSFKKGPWFVPFSLSRLGSRAPSPKYSGIAAAEVSEIRRNSELRRKSPTASGA